MFGAAKLVALAATFSTALGAYQGFNYGATWPDGRGKTQADYEAEFNAQKNLPNTNGAFSSARLYTMIQAGTQNSPISAIPAAISTQTSLLLGMWCSAGDAVFANEIQALKAAVAQYGNSVQIAGISVGSEDLYRISPTGIANKEYAGASPAVLAGYIKQVREALSGTPWSSAPIGHVDTWTAYVNASNQAVIDAVDFIGVDAYPYFQNTMDNQIGNSKALFDDAVNAVKAAVGAKPIWITETGFPTSGKASGAAVPSVEDAKKYWDQVYCSFKGQVNIWWYTLLDSGSNPSFGVLGGIPGQPLFDLSCKDVAVSSSSPPPTSTNVAPTSSGAVPTTSPTGTSGGDKTDSVKPPSSTGTIQPTVGGGSPGTGGNGGAVPSSILTITTSTAPTGTPGSNGTMSPPQPTGSQPPTTVAPNAAATAAGSFGGAFLAVMAAILML